MFLVPLYLLSLTDVRTDTDTEFILWKRNSCSYKVIIATILKVQYIVIAFP